MLANEHLHRSVLEFSLCFPDTDHTLLGSSQEELEYYIDSDHSGGSLSLDALKTDILNNIKTLSKPNIDNLRTQIQIFKKLLNTNNNKTIVDIYENNILKEHNKQL